MNPKVALASTILFVGLCFAGAVTFAKADDTPAKACFTIEQATAAAQSAGGSVINLVDVPGSGVDQLLVASVGGTIQVWPALKGCMVGSPTPLAAAKKPDTLA